MHLNGTILLLQDYGRLTLLVESLASYGRKQLRAAIA